MKLIDKLSIAKAVLKDSGISTPFLDAEILMAQAINKSREFIIGNPEYELAKLEELNFDCFVQRRKCFEPVAKIIGKKEFWGREFTVSSATLDPRPDSETLIETVLDIFPDRSSDITVLDLGTGSGCLLLTILAEYSNSQGLGLDIDPNTLNIAKINANNLELAKRCSFVVNNWLYGLEGKFDLIISNPPYIKNSDIEKLKPEVSTHEPKRALDGGEDGLDCYRQIAPLIKNMLSENAYVVFEFGKGQADKVREICESSKMGFVSFKNDLTGTPRCIVLN